MTQQSTKPTSADVVYLLSRGWREFGESPWSWVHKSCPGAYYRLADAVALARAQEREHVRRPKRARS